MTGEEKRLYERLYFRERDRRQALWKLKSLPPGDPRAEEFLARLDSVEDDEKAEPIGTAIDLGIEQLRALVTIVDVKTFRVILDDDIPEPWRERFNQASAGSTRIPEGFYGRDWLNFLYLWPREMEHLAQHRLHRAVKA